MGVMAGLAEFDSGHGLTYSQIDEWAYYLELGGVCCIKA